MRSRSLRRTAAPLERVGVVTFLIVVVIALLSMPSSSAPGDPAPGLSDLPKVRTITDNQGVAALSQETVVRRSKMYITIGTDEPIWAALYTFLYNTPLDDPKVYQAQCARGRRCVVNPFYQPACATDDVATQRKGQYFRSFIYPMKRRAGGGVTVGLIARTRVNLLAFGSIPASATLTLTAPRSGGRVQPLVAHVWQSSGGCEDPDANDATADALVEGKVEISLSDLKVDGVPVALGTSCRTVRPANLALWGDTAGGGYFPGQGGRLVAYDGAHGGSLWRLDDPFYKELQGRVIPPSTGLTVPPFTGCGAAENLSPIVTAMASGPNNPVQATQGQVRFWNDGFDLNDLEACDDAGYCPLPVPKLGDHPPLPAGDE